MQIVFTNVITGDTAFLEHSYTDAEFKECSVYDILADIDRFEDDASYKFFLNDEEIKGEDLHVYVEDDDLLLIVESPAGAAITLASLWKAIVEIAVSMILSWAANKLFGAKMIDQKHPPQPNASYNLNNSANYSDIGKYAGVGYGKFRLFPRIVNQPYYTYDKCEQYMFRVLAIGQGSYAMNDLMIGSQSVIKDKDIKTKLVKFNNKKITDLYPSALYKHDVVNVLDTIQNEVIVHETTGTDAVTAKPHELNTELVGVSINVVYPSGIYWTSTKDGSIHGFTSDVIIEFLDASGSVVETKNETFTDAHTANPKKQINDSARFTVKYIKPANMDWSSVKIRLKDPRGGRFGANVPSNWMNEGRVESIYELYETKVNDFGDLQCMVIEMKATDTTASNDQINGFFTRSDVGNSLKDIISDIYTNDKYGANLEGTDLQFDSIAAHTKINCYYEENLTVLDAMNKLVSPQQFHIIPHNAKLKLKKDKAQTLPVQRYDATRMYSVETSYLFDEYREVNDGIEVEYRDSDWKPVTTKYPPTCVIPEVVTTFGLESKSSAEAYCKYLYKQQKARRQMVTFSTDIQARPLELLDLIELKHDTISSDGKAKLFQVMKVASNEEESKIECIKYDSSIFN